MPSLPFLSAEWENLLVVNYEVDDPSIFDPWLPKGTEVDSFEGKYFVSLVAFYFHNTKLLGALPTIPFNNFEEVNLRFYIKRVEEGGLRRAVAFVKEVVPTRFIAWTARTFYNEPYVRLPMEHYFADNKVCYRWGRENEFEMSASVERVARTLVPESHEEFILEHYWGYTAQKNQSTTEYRVRHPAWKIRNVSNVNVSPSVQSFYGEAFRSILAKPMHSCVLAEGSPVTVSFPRNFRA